MGAVTGNYKNYNPINNVDLLQYYKKRAGETQTVGQVNGSDSNYGYTTGAVDYSVRYNPPKIDGGTNITGLGRANDTGLLKPFFA